LENSFNRYLYGSAEHLGDLLRIDDPEIVLATLTLLSILVKKTRSRVTTRIHGDPILNAQLFYLTKGWGGKQDGLGLLYCVQDRDITSKVRRTLPLTDPICAFLHVFFFGFIFNVQSNSPFFTAVGWHDAAVRVLRRP
jgi:hypothetical protein